MGRHGFSAAYLRTCLLCAAVAFLVLVMIAGLAAIWNPELGWVVLWIVARMLDRMMRGGL